jgi:threonine synthase
MPTWPSRSCRCTSTTSRPPTCARCAKTYTAEVFGTDAITPLKPLEPGLCTAGAVQRPDAGLQGHGDAAAGQPVRVRTGARGEQLNILGATSGDTGSAAEYAMRGKQGVRVFMLSPHGRMSPFQQAQMFSLQDANIHNIAVEGVFDDCQDIVKAVSPTTWPSSAATASAPSTRSTGRGCWRRWCTTSPATSRPRSRTTSRSLHRALGQLRQRLRRPCRAHDGPADRPLVVATNENDVLDEFFRTGTLPRARQRRDHETSSPSMDISKASNFERFVFDLLGRDGARTAALFGAGCAATAAFTLTADEFARVPASASSRAAARTPTAWPPSATPGSATA